MNRLCNNTSKTGVINQQFHTLTEHHSNISNHLQSEATNTLNERNIYCIYLHVT